MIHVALRLLVVAALLASLTANVWLFRRADNYYRELNEARLDPFGLSLVAAAKPDPQRRRVVVLGDSRAQAWAIPATAAMQVLNAGIGGQTSVQVDGRYANHVQPFRPDVVILQAGINDLKTIGLFPDRRLQIIERCKASLRHVVETATRDGAVVILTTIIPPGGISPLRRMYWSNDVDLAVAEVNRHLLTLAGEKVRILDAAGLLRLPTGGMRKDLFEDELHLNASGYELLNRELGKTLKGLGL